MPVLSSLTPIRLSRSYLWFAVAVLLSFVAVGRWTLPVATWLMPVFMLRFVRDQPAARGYGLAAFGMALAGAFAWKGLIPFSGLPYYGFILFTALAGALPYLVDRLLIPRLSGLAATLVFPTAVTALEYGMSFGPYGTWGAVAYTQQNLSLLQLASVTGIWGITFLIHWTASVAAMAWERRFQWVTIRRSVIPCAFVVGVVFLAGSLRLMESSPSDSIGVAAVTAPKTAGAVLSRSSVDDSTTLRDSMRVLQADYLERARTIAGTGAQLVTWPEAAVPVSKDAEDAFLAHARSLAEETGAYLALGLAVLPMQEQSPQIDNKVVWIGPDGSVLASYLKARPVPGEPSRAGNGRLPVIHTPDGIWTSAICFDMDFPRLLRQAGQQDAELIVAPSNDWPAIASLHAHMARLRAVENGAALVRPTSHGRTLVTDPWGRTLGRMTHSTGNSPLLTVQVPTTGPFTLYPIVGDVFAWLSGLGVLVLAGASIMRARSTPKMPGPEPDPA